MKTKEIQLIRILDEAETALTSSFLANQLDISPRSVKNYIQEINAIHPNTIVSSRKGYSINGSEGKELLAQEKSSIPQTSIERTNYIINRIIKSGSINAFDLCDEMFVSYSTLKNELVKVRKILSENKLELISQNDILMANGLEKNKRQLLSSILYSESSNNFVNYDTISSSFGDIDVNYIKNTITSIFDEHHYFVNDYSLSNLVLHVTITVDRIKHGYVNSTKDNVTNTNIIKAHEHELASAIIQKLEEHYHIQFSESETTEFTLLMLSRASNLDYKSITIDNLSSYIGEDTFHLVQTLINSISSFYYIDLSEPEFFVRFALHIKNLLVRTNTKYLSKNPLTESIKQNCPLIYDVAVHTASDIQEICHIQLNDDEIAYIAFHIGGALEIQKSLASKLSVSIFFPQYYDLTTKLADDINKHFSDSIVVSNIFTDLDSLEKSQSSLIISTMKIDVQVSAPVLVISPFLTEQDIAVISRKTADIQREKRRQTFEEQLKALILPEFFEVRPIMKGSDSAIHYLAEKFRKAGYVHDAFEDEVRERERMSSTAFDLFAIPHAMKMHEPKTGMNILILENPIDWDGKPVQLVMMLCFNKNERYIFNEIFEPLTMILTEKENLKTVLKCRDYTSFVSAR